MLMTTNSVQSTLPLAFLSGGVVVNKFGVFCFGLSSLFKNRLYVGCLYIQFLNSHNFQQSTECFFLLYLRSLEICCK